MAEKSASDQAAAEAASAWAASAATAITATAAAIPVAAGPGAPSAAPDDALMQRLALFNKVKDASPGMCDESIVLLVDGHMRQLFPQPPVVQAPPAMPLPPPPVPVAPAPEPSTQLPLLPPPEPLPQGGLLKPKGPLSRCGSGIDVGGAVNRQQAFQGRGRKRCGYSVLENAVLGDDSAVGRVGRRVGRIGVDQKDCITVEENCSGFGVDGGLAPASVSVPAEAAPVGADAQSAPDVKRETDLSPLAATPAIKQEKNPSPPYRNASNSDQLASVAKAYANMNTQVMMPVVSLPFDTNHNAADLVQFISAG